MSHTRRAVIDVGTNSVKLLVADVAGHAVTPLTEQSEQTRLGRGFYATHRLQTSAIERTARAVAAFVAEAARMGAVSTRVIATSAARDAENRADLVSAILEAAKVTVEIISGEQEADWAFQGIASDPRLANRPLLIMDTGGGSTQLIYFDGAKRHVRHSFRLGAVRLLEQLHPSDPPTPGELAHCREWLRGFIRQHILPVMAPDRPPQTPFPAQLVGTGGSSGILISMHLRLASFNRDLIETAVVTRPQVQQLTERLWTISLAERKHIPGLPPPKADVALMGAAIHEAIMEQFAFPDLRASTRGLRFAALVDSVP